MWRILNNCQKIELCERFSYIFTFTDLIRNQYHQLHLLIHLLSDPCHLSVTRKTLLLKKVHQDLKSSAHPLCRLHFIHIHCLLGEQNWTLLTLTMKILEKYMNLRSMPWWYLSTCDTESHSFTSVPDIYPTVKMSWLLKCDLFLLIGWLR